VHSCFNRPVEYKKTSLFPSWILKSGDWKSMRGIIRNREIMAAFKTHNHLREPAQIDLIRTWLGQHWDMARHLGPRRCTALAKAVQYFEIATDEIIIREGERGYTFYIIIEGEVTIYKRGGAGVPTVDKNSLGMKVGQLGVGKCFGERALTADQYEYRQATVVSSSQPKCKLLVLHKSDYDTILKNYSESVRTEAYKVRANNRARVWVWGGGRVLRGGAETWGASERTK
jgi:hypothetical protein